MTVTAPIYDLTLLLDPQAEEDARAKVLADTRASIEAHGELVRHDEWGERALTYPIKKRKSAEYHLLQFHTGENELLSGLERTLHITDGVLRFRLIKLKPGVGAPPDMRSGAAPVRRADEPGAPEAHAARVGAGAEHAPPDAAAEPVAPAEPAAAAEHADPVEQSAPAEPAAPEAVAAEQAAAGAATDTPEAADEQGAAAEAQAQGDQPDGEPADQQ